MVTEEGTWQIPLRGRSNEDDKLWMTERKFDVPAMTLDFVSHHWIKSEIKRTMVASCENKLNHSSKHFKAMAALRNEIDDPRSMITTMVNQRNSIVYTIVILSYLSGKVPCYAAS